MEIGRGLRLLKFLPCQEAGNRVDSDGSCYLLGLDRTQTMPTQVDNKPILIEEKNHSTYST